MLLPQRRRRRPSTFYVPAVIVAALMLVGGWLLIRKSAADAPTSRALERYLAAGRSQDCPAVWFHLSAQTKRLALTFPGERASTEQQAITRLCSYTPGTSDMEHTVPGSARTETVEGTRAVVTAKYKYDRFFGFFGEGTAKQRFELVKEGGAWKVDYSEELDPASPANLDAAALRLVYQGWSAERDFYRQFGYMTSEPSYLQAQLPGFPFGTIVQGVANRASPAEVLHVAIASKKVACLSVRSGTGTVVMVKMIEGGERERTYQYGTVPSSCDQRPLQRNYPGYSARIIREER